MAEMFVIQAQLLGDAVQIRPPVVAHRAWGPRSSTPAISDGSVAKRTGHPRRCRTMSVHAACVAASSGVAVTTCQRISRFRQLTPFGRPDRRERPSRARRSPQAVGSARATATRWRLPGDGLPLRSRRILPTLLRQVCLGGIEHLCRVGLRPSSSAARSVSAAARASARIRSLSAASACCCRAVCSTWACACARAVSASASSFSAAFLRSAIDGDDRAEQKRRSSHSRIRTLTVCRTSVDQSKCISAQTGWRTATATRSPGSRSPWSRSSPDPTNSVREIVPAASGCRAIASMAAATARPSPERRSDRAEGNREAAAPRMLASWIQFMASILPFLFGCGWLRRERRQ